MYVCLAHPFFSFLESHCPNSGGVPILSQIKHIREELQNQKETFFVQCKSTLTGEVLTRESSVLS